MSLTATGNGTANVVFYPAGQTLSTPQVFTFPVRRGQSGSMQLAARGPARTLRFAGRTYRATSGVGLRVSGLPRKLPKHARTVRLIVRDQFGEPVPGVIVKISGRGVSMTSLTDSGGAATITLSAVRGGLSVSFSAPTYRTLALRLK